MTILSKEQILAAQDLPVKEVPVPEWNGSIMIRTMTGSERDQYEQELIRSRSKDTNTNIKNIRALLLVYTLVDADGNRLFTMDEVDDLGGKSIKAIDRLYNEASRANALSASDVEELAGNSDAAQSGDTILTSQDS